MYSYSSSTGGYGYSSNTSKFQEIRPLDKDQPLDTVSQIIWNPYHNDPAFFVASWDGYVRYYILNHHGDLKLAWSFFFEHPVLTIDLSPQFLLFAGLATGDIAVVKMQTNDVAKLGSHDAPICGLFFIKQKNCVMSLGFDNMILFWSLEGGGKPAHTVQLPLKTHTCAFDYPYLLIGSCQSSICTINLRNLPNCNFPRQIRDYQVREIKIFSKFTCARLLAEPKKIIMGTCDGRSLTMFFKQTQDRITYGDGIVNKTQKKMGTGMSNAIYGQVNTVDLGFKNHETFCLVGGTDNLRTFTLSTKNEGPLITSSSTSIGATTASRLSPSLEFIAFATGTDWCKGIHELDHIKKPLVSVIRLSESQLRRLISR